jgi:GTPase SAR1 family protein
MDTIDMFLNYGGLGILAYIMYLYGNRMEKKLDQQQDRYLSKIEAKEHKDEQHRVALLEKYEQREEMLRARYDEVIQNLEQQRQQQVSEVKELLIQTGAKLENVNTKIQLLEQKTISLEAALEALKLAVVGSVPKRR